MNNYKKNLAVIEAYNPDLATKIDKSIQPEYIQLNKSRNRKPNFLYKHGSVYYAAYNMTNPNKEIKNMLQKQKCEFHKDTGSILVGAGFGHYIYEFCKCKDKNHHLIVIEPDSYFIKKSFENYNFTKWFTNGTLMFVGRENDLAYAVHAIDTAIVIQGWNVICSNYAYNQPKEYGKIIENANGLINQMNCNIGTVMGAGPQIAENDILNLPYIIRHRGVKELKDIYKGVPAVLVSTGPSLEKNVFHLKKMGSRVIIIAVAQALRVLEAYDIKPDFICTVDYGKVNEDHFKGLYNSDVPLVALNRTYAPILKKWKGTKFIVSSQPEIAELKNTVAGIISQKGCLLQGGSVSHMALGLALHMGCDPLIMIGQDLSYPGKKSHIPLADASGNVEEKEGVLEWDVKDNRSILGKKKYRMSNTVMVHGYFGGLVKTNRGLASFITTYERIIKDIGDSKIIINATEGGAKIHGTEQYTLVNAIEKYGKFNINKKQIKHMLGMIENPDRYIENIIPLLEYDIESMKKVAGCAKKGLKMDEEIKKLNKRKKMGWLVDVLTGKGKNITKLAELLKQNKEYSNKAEQIAAKLPLLGLSIYYENRLIHNRDLKVKGKLKHILKNQNDLKIRLRRNEIILTAAKKACTRLIGLYKKTIQILKDHLAGKDVLTSKEEYIPDISDAAEMFKARNWGRPLLEARLLLKANPAAVFIEKKALEMRKKSIERNQRENKENAELIRYYRWIEQARKKGQKGEFAEALRLLKQAVDIFPKKEAALYGYATALYHCKLHEMSIKVYEKLMKLNPEYLQYKFEYGQVLLQLSIQEGMKVIGEVMAKTKAFDAFVVRVGDMYFEKGMYDQAIIAYENYLKKFPPDTNSLTNLMKSYKMIGKGRLAKKLLNKYRSWIV